MHFHIPIVQYKFLNFLTISDMTDFLSERARANLSNEILKHFNLLKTLRFYSPIDSLIHGLFLTWLMPIWQPISSNTIACFETIQSNAIQLIYRLFQGWRTPLWRLTEKAKRNSANDSSSCKARFNAFKIRASLTYSSTVLTCSFLPLSVFLSFFVYNWMNFEVILFLCLCGD